MDRIVLRNMVFYTYHGVFAAEREIGQRLEVDVEIAVRPRTSGIEDDLGGTIDYADVYDLVRQTVTEQDFNLLETIADRIAAGILNAHELSSVVVRVRKPNPPVGGPVDCAEVEVKRRARRLAPAGDSVV